MRRPITSAAPSASTIESTPAAATRSRERRSDASTASSGTPTVTTHPDRLGRHATPAILDAVARKATGVAQIRSEEHTSELQSHHDLVCRLLLEKKNTIINETIRTRVRA